MPACGGPRPAAGTHAVRERRDRPVRSQRTCSTPWRSFLAYVYRIAGAGGRQHEPHASAKLGRRTPTSRAAGRHRPDRG